MTAAAAIDEKIDHLQATEKKVQELTMLAISERVAAYLAEHADATLAKHQQG